MGKKWSRKLRRRGPNPYELRALMRLLVVRLLAQHGLTVKQIMKATDVCRQAVFVYRDKA